MSADSRRSIVLTEFFGFAPAAPEAQAAM